jgi:hypothetical protein
MTALAGNKARIFLNEVDLSCVTSTLTVEQTVGEYDATTLCSNVMEYRPGMSQGGISIDGYFNGVVDGEEVALYNALGANNKTAVAIFDYTALPCPAYVAENASNLGLTHTSPTDGLITMNGTFKGREGVRRGKMLFYKAVRSATGLATAVQNVGVTTSSTGRIFCFLHGWTGSRTGNITFDIKTSANGTTGWASEASFTFSGKGASAASLSTPAGPYFNIDVTSLGGTSSVTISVVVIKD